MRAVNLLPKELVAERRALPGFVGVAGAAAVPLIAVVLVVIGYSRAHSTVKAEQAQLAAAQAAATAAASRAAASAASASVPPAEAALAAVRTQRLSALRAVLGKEMPWDVTLGQLARVLPTGVWLSDLTASSPVSEGSATTTTSSSSTPPSGGGTTFTIDGYGHSEADVAQLLQRLQLLPVLTNVSLATASQTTIGKTSVVQFQITATVQSPSTGTQP
jgi:Tfp pilus assembly protein PilN